jgi:hypothetical protein
VNWLLESTEGPWEDIDGEGGRICDAAPGRILIHNRGETLQEVRRQLAKLRSVLTPPAPVDPHADAQLETRYYYTAAQTAEDLSRAIPRLIAQNTWYTPESPFLTGQIEIVHVDSAGVWGASGAFSDRAGGGGPGAGGFGFGRGGGGGFFQLAGGIEGGLGGGISGASPSADAATAPQTAPGTPPAPHYAVLVITQTRAVHRQIAQLLSELLHGNPRGRIEGLKSEVLQPSPPLGKPIGSSLPS